MEPLILLLQLAFTAQTLFLNFQLFLPHVFPLAPHPLNLGLFLTHFLLQPLKFILQLLMLLRLDGQRFLFFTQLGPFPVFLLSDFHELQLKLTLVLIQPLRELLQLRVSFADVAFDLGQSLILLLETVLVHLVEVHVRHQRVAFVAHSVLGLVNLGKPPFRAR